MVLFVCQHNGVPIFAADLGLLEPMKSCSLDATTSNCSSTCSINQKEQATCQSNSFASQAQVNENREVATNVSETKSDDKLVQGSCLELTADSLDFLDGCSNSTKDGKAVSSMSICCV